VVEELNQVWSEPHNLACALELHPEGTVDATISDNRTDA
jgi:hypothetical protein